MIAPGLLSSLMPSSTRRAWRLACRPSGFRPKDGSGGDGVDFHRRQRKNDTHASTTDPESRLYHKAAGREAKLSYMGHATMENRHGLAVAGKDAQATGTAEREASEEMLTAQREQAGHRISVGEDEAYDTANHVAALRELEVTPHVAQSNAPTYAHEILTTAELIAAMKGPAGHLTGQPA
ncbi:MAG: hypothetical protein ACREDL_02880 [Bradyrhizobium sp.]